MKIQSILNEDDLLYEENLSKLSEGELLEKSIETQPKHTASAKASLKLSRDFCIIDTRFDFKKPTVDKFSISGDFIMISCVVRGESVRQNLEKDRNLELGQVHFSYSKKINERVRMPQSKTRYICLLISRTKYLDLLKNESWVARDPFYTAIKTSKRIPLGTYSFPLGFQMNQIISEILECKWEHPIQLEFIQLKIKELLLHVFNISVENPSKEEANLSENSKEKIEKAKAYLTVNYKNPPTIKKLSRIVLINEVHLKSGFKKLYGTTIKKFVIDLRMQKAYSLLKSKSVNEIAESTGYKSVPHFIATFKKYYGQTPKQVLVQQNA
ncbi:AraC family transcriptional regulator [Leeuwenhoekiella palythoae]|uniref:AraC family transcriptional regulator n=1 Tax=Leeuwenhoekiella palythoae TaxID=573501 RepID=UPI001CE1FC15|nr:AraC family transcriptional regulator [Leeuwenhoekiella palythoae]UBZ11376.1 AraC family transcriptional regulator [Leeuwenhoekiella palythoae]